MMYATPRCPHCGKAISPVVMQQHVKSCQAKKEKDAEEAENREIERQAFNFEIQYLTWMKTPQGRFEAFYARGHRKAS